MERIFTGPFGESTRKYRGEGGEGVAGEEVKERKQMDITGRSESRI